MTANTMFAYFNLGLEGSRLFNRTFNEREVTDYLNKAQLELIKQRYASFRNSKGIGIMNYDVPQAAIVRSSELAGLMSGSATVTNANMIQGTSDNGALKGTDWDRQQGVSSEFYGVFTPIPDEAMYVLFETVDTADTSTEYTTPNRYNVPVKEVSYEQYALGVYDYYAQPYDSLVWVIDWGSYTTSSLNAGNGTFTNSEKEYTLEGTGYNMQGIAADGLGTNTIVINTARSRYLLPGKGSNVVNYKCFYLKLPKEMKVDLVNPSAQINSELADFLHQEVVDLAVKLASAALVAEQGKYQVNQIESKEDE